MRMVSTMNTGPKLPSNDPVGNESRPWHAFYPPEVSRRIPDMRENSLSDLVHHTAQQHGDAVAFSNLGGTLTFNDVDRLATDFAHFLQSDLGLAKGDRIVIQMPNLLQYPVALFGALRAGLVVVNANPLYTVNEMARVLEDATPRAIVALANFADKVEEVLPGSSIEHVIITEVADLLPQPRRSIVNFVAARIKRMVPRYDLPQAVSFRDALAGGRGAILSTRTSRLRIPPSFSTPAAPQAGPRRPSSPTGTCSTTRNSSWGRCATPWVKTSSPR